MKQSKYPIPYASKFLFIYNNWAVQYVSSFMRRGRKTLATLLHRSLSYSLETGPHTIFFFNLGWLTSLPQQSSGLSVRTTLEL